MKKTLIGFIAIGLLMFVGCEKEEDDLDTETNSDESVYNITCDGDTLRNSLIIYHYQDPKHTLNGYDTSLYEVTKNDLGQFTEVKLFNYDWQGNIKTSNMNMYYYNNLGQIEWQITYHSHDPLDFNLRIKFIYDNKGRIVAREVHWEKSETSEPYEVDYYNYCN